MVVKTLLTVMVTVILAGVVSCLSGCSAGSDAATGDVTPPPPSTDNYLRPTAFSGNVLKLESRFISYSKKANRLSIIDPLQEIELWGRAAPGFDFALALPDFSGGSLFDANRVVVMSGNEQKTFSLSAPYLHTAVANDIVAYSLGSADGRTFEVIRSLGAGQWQQQVFTVPWGAIDPDLNAPPQGEPVLLVTQFNRSGTRLTVFAPADGRYAVYEADSPAHDLAPAGNWCAGDGVGTPGDATFRSLVWDEVLQTFYAGDKNGRLYSLDTRAGCLEIANLTQIAFAHASPVVQLSLLSPGRLGVIQDSVGEAGSLSIVNYDGDGFSIEPNFFDNVCDVPLGSMMLVGEYIAVLCTQESNLLAPTDKTANPNDLWIDPRSYIVFNINTGERVNQATIDKAASSGVAIDPSTAVLYRMLEGGFGHLEITNLLTGETRTTIGLYIKDILN